MKTILSLLLTIVAFTLFAQQSYLSSEKIFTTKSGLSSDKIHSLYKDSKGFIWIGTENGLDRFDGQYFVHFSKSTHSKMTLDRVQFIAEDDEGYLWLLEKNKPFEHYFTKPKLNFYNIHTGKWLTFKERFPNKMPFDPKDFSYIKQMDNGSIFFILHGKGKGYIYKKGQLEKYELPQETARVSDVTIQKDGSLMIESVDGFNAFERYIFHLKQNGKILKQVEPKAPIIIQSEDKNYQFQLQGSDYLIGGSNLATYQLFYPNLEIETTSNTSFIDQSVWNKEQQLLWLKSPSNIYAVKQNGKIIYQKTIHQDQFEMPIIFDGETTWYSDKQNGLVALTLRPNYFQTYQYFTKGFNNSARGIYAGTKGDIWISTRKGILHKASKSDEFTFTKTNIFSSFLKGSANNLWSFRETNIAKYDLITGKEQLIPHDHLNGYNTWSMYEADDGNLWFYGNAGYFYIFDTKRNELKGKPSHLSLTTDFFNVYDIQKIADNFVLLCTNQGLYIVDNNGEFIAHYHKNKAMFFEYVGKHDVNLVFKQLKFNYLN